MPKLGEHRRIGLLGTEARSAIESAPRSICPSRLSLDSARKNGRGSLLLRVDQAGVHETDRPRTWTDAVPVPQVLKICLVVSVGYHQAPIGIELRVACQVHRAGGPSREYDPGSPSDDLSLQCQIALPGQTVCWGNPPPSSSHGNPSLRARRTYSPTGSLAALEELFGLKHSMVLLPDETGQRLVTIASRGYGTSGVGAEAQLGSGLIGTVAATRKLLRVSGLGQELRYGRAIRERVRDLGGDALLAPEIPLPGLPNAASQLALPMLVGDELNGVIVFESESSLAMRLWHESFLQILANQIAIGLDRMRQQEEDEPVSTPPSSQPSAASSAPANSARGSSDKTRKFQFFRNDDCVFVDGEYLVRNVPGKILWKILNENQRGARTQFTNRELRLDPTLGLPAIKDNLESRLILLRKRLAEKCPEVRLVPTQRGRFALELGCPIELAERDHG